MNQSYLRQLRDTARRLVHRFIEVIAGILFSLVYHGPGQKMPPIQNLLLLDSATAIAHKIRTKKITSVEVVETFIARIKEINPVLNCVVDERFEDALKEAREVDKLIESGQKTESELAEEKPFLGVPFTTKDCIGVKGMSFTSGIFIRKDVKSMQDAPVIAALRNSGAIPLAITNVSELCMWWESNNTIYGRTNNPYNTNHIVGGSSGGEGCIQAAAGSPMGIGSDIGGSIRMPCFFNGIFGHKPSREIVSNEGQYPLPVGEQNTYLGTGPMCRFATDLLPMLRVISQKSALHQLKLDEKVDIRKLKYYYMEDNGGGSLVSPVDPEIKEALRKVVSHLDKAHGIKAKKVNITKLKKSAPIWFAKMKVEGCPAFAEQLANLDGRINAGWELLKCLLFLSNHTLIGILTCFTEDFGVKCNSSKHRYLWDECQKLAMEFKDLLGDDGVFLYPTHPTPAPFHNEPLIKPMNFSYTAIINVLGLPATHCPLGLNKNGLPIGIQVVSSLNNDRLSLAVALELEKAFGGWVPPSITV